MARVADHLMETLVKSIVGNECDNKVYTDLQRLCLSMVNNQGSHIGDDFDISRLEKHLVVHKNVSEAAKVSRLCRELCNQRTLSQTSNVAEFLYRVAVNNERTQVFNSGVKSSSTPLHAQISAIQTPLSLRPQLYNSKAPATDVAQLPPSSGDVAASSRHHQSVSSSGLGTSRASTKHPLTDSSNLLHTATLRSHHQTTHQDSLQTTHKAPSQTTSFVNYKELSKEDIHEQDLLREVLLIAQGIEGKVAKFDPKANAYRLPDNVRVPLHKRNVCYKLFEAGWLYNRIRGYVEQKKGDATFGPIGLSFCVALQHELRCYLRLIAVLDAQVADHEMDVTKGLTLLRLLLWFREPIENLKLASCLVDVSKGKKGGALLSTIHSYTMHGSAVVSSLVSNMLALTVKPLFGVINRWIYTGTLEDPYNEFFVAADPQVKDENLWHFKYSLRKSMIPTFIDADMARKILLTGKSVVFIQRVCHDNTQLDQRESVKDARLSDGSAMFTQQTDDRFMSMIDVVYKETSRHLMEVLYTRYNFINHLKAMRRYLLLGQGDFIQQLMDLLVGELSKDASALYLHNLNGILETAIRATNAQYEDKDILSRLDVRLLEISPGDLGWDVFSLDYRTRGPISTVFTQDTMIFYLRIFNFLWRAKRMEYALANLWRLKQHYSRLLRGMSELEDLLHSAHVISSEMIHFTQQIGYYINFEVIECAWDDLLDKVNKAEDLDHIIAAHQQFLDSIVTRCLMDEVHRGVFSQLRTIFDLIIKFQQILEGFFEKALRERDYRLETKGQRQHSSESDWGTDQDRESEERERRAEFIQTTLRPARSQLKVLSQTYQDMVTKFLVMLATQADDKLQALRFRLDFNEYYQQKEPILASPQVLKKYQPRTSSLTSIPAALGSGPRISSLGSIPTALGSGTSPLIGGATISQPVGGLVGILGGRVPDIEGEAILSGRVLSKAGEGIQSGSVSGKANKSQPSRRKAD